MKNMRDYRKIVGNETIDRIHGEAEKLSGRHIVNVSSTYQGGGVAEMLNSVIPLFNKIGVKTGWRILYGSPDFFKVTKKFHNALQGGRLNLSKRKKDIYCGINKKFSLLCHMDHDLAVVHDPQPLPIIDFYRKKQPWIFRFHVDILKPNPKLWNYLKEFIRKYDHMVVSHPDYLKKDLKIKQSVIWPAIDPLSLKNKKISEARVGRLLEKNGVERSKPIISQVSRFDRWKDPVGVMKVFNHVRKKTNCQLVLAGSFAMDDPEGQSVLEKTEKMRERSRHKKDIKIVLEGSDYFINSLQRASSVVVQKSVKEGFGLTVSEALYKGTPVVASRVGGIPLQILDGENGYLHGPQDFNGFARSIIRILEDEKLREEMGRKGREHVKENFLLTRLMLDWMKLYQAYLK